MNGWTPERRAKQAALIRTWKPWEQSTGAKTKEGKARSSRNAHKPDSFRHQLKAIRAMLKEHKDLLKQVTAL
ncbi:MAG TPA: hypothetical protein ENO09_07110 [bacterium]|nr:hypothetical protein [bacterium]